MLSMHQELDIRTVCTCTPHHTDDTPLHDITHNPHRISTESQSRKKEAVQACIDLADREGAQPLCAPLGQLSYNCQPLRNLYYCEIEDFLLGLVTGVVCGTTEQQRILSHTCARNFDNFFTSKPLVLEPSRFVVSR